MSDQQFCLRWNNYQENVTRILSRLLQNESLVDVTLCVGGKTLRAHKTILSACSPYFEKMFLENVHPHPIVVLRDFSYEDIRGLLDFMYKGEVNVTQTRLGSFITVAETLEVRGLASEDSKTKKEDVVSKSKDSSADRPYSPPPKRRRRKSADRNVSPEQDLTDHSNQDLPRVTESQPTVEPSSFVRKQRPATIIPPTLPTAQPEQDTSDIDTDLLPPTIQGPPPLQQIQPSKEILQEPPTLSKPPPLMNVKQDIHPPEEIVPDVPPQTSSSVESPLQPKEEMSSLDNRIKEELIPEDDDDDPEIIEEYSEMDFKDGPSTSQDYSNDSLPPHFFDQSGEGGAILPGIEGQDGSASGLQIRLIDNFMRISDTHLQCLHCGKVVSYNSYTNHFMTHAPRQFECAVCSKTFTRKSHLNRHMWGRHQCTDTNDSDSTEKITT